LNLPQCILCEKRPGIASSYVKHLKGHHHTTLKKNNMMLKCRCGHKIKSDNHHSMVDHKNKCDELAYSIESIDEDEQPI
ncbi:hypothetical protein PFISCL1PPCAC_22545, partial [Pristionchus fissidentatus]